MEAERVLEALPDGVLVVDAEARMLYANAAAVDLLGVSPLEGRPLAEAGAAGPALAALAARAGEAETRGTVSLGAGPVEVRVARVADERAAQVLALRTPGRLARLAEGEAEVRRLTELAAGLAHEIRNPLAGLKGAADLLARDAAAGALAPYAEVIAREAARVDHLVHQLMDLARPRPPDRRPVNVHAVADEVLLLLQPSLPEGITLERRYDPSLPDLHVDRDQLSQILLNLVRNAAEALGPRGGRIVLRTGLALGLASGTASGGRRTMARIDVEDDGPGFSPDVLEKLYTPFLSTKPTGTGLGLALCRRMVEAHGGLIEAANLEGGGAKVSLLLPVTSP